MLRNSSVYGKTHDNHSYFLSCGMTSTLSQCSNLLLFHVLRQSIASFHLLCQCIHWYVLHDKSGYHLAPVEGLLFELTQVYSKLLLQLVLVYLHHFHAMFHHNVHKTYQFYQKIQLSAMHASQAKHNSFLLVSVLMRQRNMSYSRCCCKWLQL